MRLNMRAMSLILSAVSVAALLASPAMARTRHYVPFNGAYGTYYGSGGSYGPYTPSIPTPRHGKSGDFQDGSRG
jgi:hypothetical protein